MKITGLSLWSVPLSSHTAYYMAQGKACETVTTTVIRIDTDSGVSGWGEVCPIPHYLPAFAGGVLSAMEEMMPVLIGADPVGPASVMARLDAHLKGHDYVKSAVDIALWDITGKVADLPLFRLIGGQQTDALPLYHSITCIEPEDMARIARDAQATGITQFQVKLGADGNPDADAARLRQVREAVGPEPLVYGDWNCGSTRLDAMRVSKAVDDLDVMFEQPCPSIAECAAVKNSTGRAMKLDEAVHDTTTLIQAASLACLDVAALKLSKFGGVTALCRARDLCVHFGTKACVEDTWGSDIATAAALHVGTTVPSNLLLNVCDLSGYVSPRLDPDAPTRDRGFIKAPDGPGLGITPDPDVLGQPIAVLN